MKFELSFVEEGAIKLDLASSQSNIKVRTPGRDFRGGTH